MQFLLTIPDESLNDLEDEAEEKTCGAIGARDVLLHYIELAIGKAYCKDSEPSGVELEPYESSSMDYYVIQTGFGVFISDRPPEINDRARLEVEFNKIDPDYKPFSFPFYTEYNKVKYFPMEALVGRMLVECRIRQMQKEQKKCTSDSQDQDKE